MEIVEESLFVPYTAAQMYELVNEIEAYPEFMPWCKQATILQQEPGLMRACLVLQLAGLHKSITTENQLVENESIDMQLVSGPFKKFHGVWHFRDESGGCVVSFNLNFDMANALLRMTVSKLFRTIAQSMVKAFSTRAEQVYGE